MDTHFLWDLFLLDLELSSPWILWALRSPLSFLHLWTCVTSKLSHKALASWPLLGCQQSNWHLQHSKKAELKKKEKNHYIRKWFEPRSNIPWLKGIIWVIGVLLIWVIGVLLRTPIIQMIFFNQGNLHFRRWICKFVIRNLVLKNIMSWNFAYNFIVFVK